MWNPETNIKGPKGDKGDKGDPGPGGASITIADTPPVGLPGAMWWESDSGTLFIYYADGSSEQWVQAAATVSSGGGGGVPSDTIPAMDGVAAAGVGTEYARGDHVHPSDTTKADKTYVDAQDAVLTATVGAKADQIYVEAQDAVLAAAISGKAPTVHTHAIADVTGLTAALDGKADDADVTGKVAKTGDTMSGDLGITKASPAFALDTTGAGTNGTIWGRKNGANRWVLQMPDTAAESGASEGSDWTLHAFNDAGAMGAAVHIKRATQVVTFVQSPIVPSPTAGDNSFKAAPTAFVAAAAAAKVSKTGDTMSGDLHISRSEPRLNLIKTASGQSAGITGMNGAGTRWFMNLGNGSTESGGNVGSDFDISRYSDASAWIGTGLNIRRSDGHVVLGGNLNVNGSGASGLIYFGNTGARYLQHDGTRWYLTGGPVDIGGIITGRHGGFRVDEVGVSGSVYYQGLVQGNPSWAPIDMQTVHVAGAWAGFRWAVNGPFFEFRGDGIGYTPSGGMWGAYSDTRIKNVTGEYTSGLAAICALKPMRYKFKGNETDDAPSHWRAGATEDEKAKNPAPSEAPTLPYKNSAHYGSARDDIEYIGLLAQDAEVPMPELVSKQKAYIDGVAVDDLRTMNATPVIYALVNAVKELKAEIDTLKAALATKEAR